MRLINTKKLTIESYDDGEIPPYAILSHRWLKDGELTLHDMQNPHGRWMPAWPKIEMCCRQALVDDLNYIWVDTCCIEKSSSSELSEAINSMYKWYSAAEVCYAYLNDIYLADSSKTSNTIDSEESHGVHQMPTDIVKSKWFTRAWTLQELIAPTQVIFFDANFDVIGTRHQYARQIEQATKIPLKVLEDPDRLFEYPVAVKMSWAADRTATRTEDIAYSLFGLFNVNLPLLYGEGNKAFLRLQEEIIRQTHDHSIFVWTVDSTNKSAYASSPGVKDMGFLASSPRDFRTCSDVQIKTEVQEARPYVMTNLGLQIELKIFPYDLDVYVAILDCTPPTGEPYGILLARRRAKSAIWHRLSVNGTDVVKISREGVVNSAIWQKMYIIREITPTFSTPRHAGRKVTGTTTVPFYGIRINAPGFLSYPNPSDRPYALVAHHDWDMSSISTDNRNMETGNTESWNNLKPVSDINLVMFMDKMLGSSRDRSQPQTELQVPCGILAMPQMSTGIAGMIVFDSIRDGIKAVKVGLDFDFRPVILLATHEAEGHPWIKTWLNQYRFMELERFGYRRSLLDTRSEDDLNQYWSSVSDSLGDLARCEPCDDGSYPVCKGVFAFTCQDASTFEHWIFNPYRTQPWHLALELEKRLNDGIGYWEFTMNRQEEVVSINIEAVGPE